MYKLENNVAWTEDLKNAFKHNITRAKIVYTDYGDEITIDENNGIKEIVLEDSKYVPNTGFIGQATARKVTITLLDNSQLTNLENKDFALYIGADYNDTTYYINYGNFIVNEPPENDSTNGTIKIVAYDYMIKFNQNYENQVVYPCTLKDYVLNICSQAGVELGSESFANDDFIVVNNQFEGKQLREVLQHVGKCAFSWARIGQDNKLYFDFHVNDVNAVTENITIDDYKRDAYKRANEYYGPVNRVTYAETDIQGEEESVSDQESISQYGENEIVIYDNYFAYTTSARHELIQQGTALFGFKYMPISQLDLIGFVYLDCNDFVKVFDENENYIISRVFSHTIKYNGAVSDNIETEGQSDNESIYKNKNTTISNNSRTEIIVDRANKKIIQVVEDVTEQNTKIATLTQTVDDLTSQISDLADITTYGESSFASVSLDDVNTSEPIMLKVHPVSTNISYYYPNTSLYPDLSLFMSTRTVRFTRTYEVEGQEHTENIDYELPDNLLYYDSEHYDEFYLDYESQTCQITKRCGYNADGTTYVLNNEVITTYDYPLIDLEEGDYTISLLGYEYGYIYVRLMAKNIYTTQFYTKVETDSKIQQKADSIDLSVNQKLTNYSTTSEMNSAIQLSKDSITSSVSETYITKQNSAKNIDTAKQAAIDSANNSTDEKLEDYYTKTETNSQIAQTANSITSTVSATYSTKTETNTAKTQAINSANSSTDTKLKNYYTKTETNSQITQKANEITTSVSETYLTKSNASSIYATQTTANTLSSRIKQTAKSIELVTTDNKTSAGITIRLKNEDGTQIDSDSANITLSGLVKFTDLSTSGSTTINGSNITTGIIKSSNYVANKSGTSINLSNGIIDTKGFKVSSTGNITATAGTIAGWNIQSSYLQKIIGNNNYSLEIRADRGANEAALAVWDIQNNRYNWYVTADGRMYARNADISGTITSSNATITGGKLSLTGGNQNDPVFLISGSGNVRIVGSYMWMSGENWTDAYLSLRFNPNSTNQSVQLISSWNGGNISVGDGNITNFFEANGRDGYVAVYGPMYANSFNNNSKEELKKNIQKYNKSALKIIAESNIYEFNYKTEKDGEKRHIGFIIGEQYETPKDVISQNGESIDTYSMISVLWKATQEQQQQIEELKQKLEYIGG